MDEVSSATSANLSNQISVLVAKKAMDVDKEQAEALVELIRQAAPPAPQQGGQGRLDLYA